MHVCTTGEELELPHVLTGAMMMSWDEIGDLQEQSAQRDSVHTADLPCCQ